MEWLELVDAPTDRDFRRIDRDASSEMYVALQWLNVAPEDPEHMECVNVEFGDCDSIGWAVVEWYDITGVRVGDEWFSTLVVIEDDRSVTYYCRRCYPDVLDRIYG